jgi:hypothetical protein
MLSPVASKRLPSVTAGLLGGGVAVVLAVALPRATGSGHEIGATTSAVDTAAFAVVGLGLGVGVAAFLSPLVSKGPALDGALTGAVTAFAVVVVAILAAPLDTDRLSRFFDIPFVAIGVAPIAVPAAALGVTLRGTRSQNVLP